MIANLRESKAKLSELVQRASQGEEILITVRGKPRARLVPVATPKGKPDLAAWGKELRKRRKKIMPAPAQSSREIIDDLRSDRF